MRRIVLLLVIALAATWNVRAVEHDVGGEAQRFSQMYFAPMDGANFILFSTFTQFSALKRSGTGWAAV